MARLSVAFGAGGLMRACAKRAWSWADSRMIWSSSIARCAASCAALTTKSFAVDVKLGRAYGAPVANPAEPGAL